MYLEKIPAFVKKDGVLKRFPAQELVWNYKSIGHTADRVHQYGMDFFSKIPKKEEEERNEPMGCRD